MSYTSLNENTPVHICGWTGVRAHICEFKNSEGNLIIGEGKGPHDRYKIWLEESGEGYRLSLYHEWEYRTLVRYLISQGGWYSKLANAIVKDAPDWSKNVPTSCQIGVKDLRYILKGR